MSTFFKPLRRKVGVLTLILACVFAAGWVRSILVEDEITYVINSSEHAICSGDHHLVWLILQDGRLRQSEFPRWNVEPLVVFNEFFNRKGTTWSWQVCGFLVGNAQNGKLTIFVASYWLIVIPLTLLSALLLLSKARVTKPLEQQGSSS